MIRVQRRGLTVLVSLLLIGALGGVAAWIAFGRATPLEKDCATVTRLAEDSHQLQMWMKDGLNDPAALRDSDDTVKRYSKLGDDMRAAAHSVTTADLKAPLNTWADAMALFAQLQQEANAKWLFMIEGVVGV